MTISGFERECECAECGRPLKLGVKIAETGTLIGADCFIRKIARNRNRFSGNGKPSAEWVKQLGIIASKGLDYAGKRYGMGANAFVFEIAA